MKLSALKSVAASQTLLINEQSRLMEQGGRDVFKFGFGQSPFSPPGSVQQAFSDAVAEHGYAPVQGDETLRNHVAAFHGRHQGLQIDPDDILIAPGSKALLFNIMASFSDATVLIPAPAWVSYGPQADILGHEVLAVPTQANARWRVTPETLEATVRQRVGKGQNLLILNYPGNPDGLSYTADELSALAQVARDHNILIIADEIYGLLDHQGNHRSMAEFYPQGTIITTGLSKWCGAGGWRLGVAILPAGSLSLRTTLLGLASETYSCAPTPVQWAARVAYDIENTQIDGFLTGQRAVLRSIGQWSASTLTAAGVHVVQPTGGFYLFTDFSPLLDKEQACGLQTAQEFCAALLQDTGVVLLPGPAFGMSEDHLCARLAYVEFDGDAALGYAAQADDDIPTENLPQIAPRQVEGINRMAEWVSAL
ncbi:MAG: pyridoxal phosphate-dependent aminotransferase [Alphaproteobacteria bacterium]